MSTAGDPSTAAPAARMGTPGGRDSPPVALSYYDMTRYGRHRVHSGAARADAAASGGKGKTLLPTPVISAALGAADAAVSFAEVFAEIHADCVRLAWHLTSSREDAEDIAADVLAAAWQRYERGKIDDLRRYLLRAVANRSKSWLRRRYVRARVHATASGDHRGVQWHDDRVADRDEMWTALQQLPTKQRMAVVLRYYEGLSVEETADVLGVREGTVKSNTSRGLARLEELLAAGEAER